MMYFNDGADHAAGGLAAGGGSGIVIIRGSEDDLLPVYFDGTRMSQIYFNNERVQSLTVNGTKYF